MITSALEAESAGEGSGMHETWRQEGRCTQLWKNGGISPGNFHRLGLQNFGSVLANSFFSSFLHRVSAALSPLGGILYASKLIHAYYYRWSNLSSAKRSSRRRLTPSSAINRTDMLR